MENEPIEIHRGVEFVQSDDLEDFALKLGQAIGKWQGPLDTPPSVAFSHTATPDGFNYVGIVMGSGTGDTEAKLRPIEDDN